MAKKKKSDISQSGEKEMSSSSPQQQQPLQPENPSAKYYQSISNLPLSRYKECVVNDNLAALIISGFPSQDQLTQAWEKINQEYADTMGNHEYQLYLKLYKEINLINCTIEQVKVCVTQLEVLLLLPDSVPEKAMYRDFYSKDLNALLLTQFIFDFNNIELYKRNLQRCLNRSKGVKLELDMVMARYEVIKQKYENGKKADESYFDAILITLSDHCGYHLTDAITVFEFCERIKRLNDAANRTNRSVRRPK